MKFKLLLLLMCSYLYAVPNETTISGATGVQIYLRNYSYANLSLSMPRLSIGLATDNNRLVYKNSAGTMFKLLTDASGASNAASGRIFYSDANGAATSSSGLTYDGSTLDVAGLAKADSNHVSDSRIDDSLIVKEVVASGRLKGTDIDVSDSVKGVTGAFSGTLTSTRDSSSDVIASDTVKAGSVVTAPWSSFVYSKNLVALRGFGGNDSAGHANYYSCGAADLSSAPGWTKLMDWTPVLYAKRYANFLAWSRGRGTFSGSLVVNFMQEGTSTTISDLKLVWEPDNAISGVNPQNFALLYNATSSRVELWYNDLAVNNKQLVFSLIKEGTAGVATGHANLYYGASGSLPTFTSGTFGTYATKQFSTIVSNEVGIGKISTAPLDVAGLARADSASVSDLRVGDSTIGNYAIFEKSIKTDTFTVKYGIVGEGDWTRQLKYRTNTVDGSDNKGIGLYSYGPGMYGFGRGAYIEAYGNEYGEFRGGDIDIVAGEGSGTDVGGVNIRSNNGTISLNAELGVNVNKKLDVNGATKTTSLDISSSSYSVNPLKIGNYYLWIDLNGRLRIKGSAPTSDTDGTVVGSQS
jgi:hypothetical protein